MIRFTDSERTVEIDDSQAMKERIFDQVVMWLKDHEAWIGETVMQKGGSADAAPFLAEVVDDVLRPTVTVK